MIFLEIIGAFMLLLIIAVGIAKACEFLGVRYQENKDKK